MGMAMISMNDLFYGEREAVQIVKDENREILEIIHRYNYFYTEPPPQSDVDVSTDDSEDEDLENKWAEIIESPVRDSDERRDGNEGKSPGQPEKEVASKLPMRCAECEEKVTIVLKSVAGNQPMQGYQSRDNSSCLLTLVGIIIVIGIIVVLAITLSVHSVRT